MDILDSLELSTIFNHIPNPVFIKNEHLQFIFINKAYESMFNVKMKQILGKTVLDLDYIPEQDRVFYQKEDMEVLLHGKTKHHIFNYLYKGQEMHTCLYWSSGFVQKNGMRGLIGVIVDINKQSKKIHELHNELRTINVEKDEVIKKSKLDPLTHLYTRAAFDEALPKLAAPGSDGFSCIMFDIDHFKRVNDTFGHIAGDTVLKAVASLLKEHSRERDIVCRYGGEEFIMLLPGVKVDRAIMVAERIRRCIQKHVYLPDGQCVTISAGCSAYITGEPGTAVVQRADKALYMAKDSGRNSVCAIEGV
ncbi:MAG: diguanylate cyclase [Desulfovibrionaceae bacterium]|nr:diguanylate cyclase [Desulfovibrionaceae bacterium]